MNLFRRFWNIIGCYLDVQCELLNCTAWFRTLHFYDLLFYVGCIGIFLVEGRTKGVNDSSRKVMTHPLSQKLVRYLINRIKILLKKIMIFRSNKSVWFFFYNADTFCEFLHLYEKINHLPLKNILGHTNNLKWHTTIECSTSAHVVKINKTWCTSVANKSACYQPIGGYKSWRRIDKYRYKVSTPAADDTRARTTLIHRLTRDCHGVLAITVCMFVCLFGS